MNNEWIPVTERLPDKVGFCLISRLRCVGEKECEIAIEYYRRDRYHLWEDTSNYMVMAWMKLPQPYEPQS